MIYIINKKIEEGKFPPPPISPTTFGGDLPLRPLGCQGATLQRDGGGDLAPLVQEVNSPRSHGGMSHAVREGDNTSKVHSTKLECIVQWAIYTSFTSGDESPPT